MNRKSSKTEKPSMKVSSKKASNPSRLTTPVIQMTERGRRIKKYRSICEASAITGVNSGSISKVVRGICQTAGGFRWTNA